MYRFKLHLFSWNENKKERKLDRIKIRKNENMKNKNLIKKLKRKKRTVKLFYSSWIDIDRKVRVRKTFSVEMINITSCK